MGLFSVRYKDFRGFEDKLHFLRIHFDWIEIASHLRLKLLELIWEFVGVEHLNWFVQFLRILFRSTTIYNFKSVKFAIRHKTAKDNIFQIEIVE